MRVIGAGMAGLLAAGMLRSECTEVLEAKSGLPDNHSAVLRFRSSLVGDTLNIPFKKVKAVKASIPWQNSVADMMAYSYKTNGEFAIRSIASANGELVDRWIAPTDFLQRMVKAVSAPIRYATQWEPSKDPFDPHNFTISTLPMPVLMTMLNYSGHRPKFESVAGYSLRAKVQSCSLFASVYLPDPEVGPYRVSITGDQLISEVVYDGIPATAQHFTQWFEQTYKALGLKRSQVGEFEVHSQPFMKIRPVDEDARRRFIMWATDKHGIFSLGRFATWRPGLLLDDVVNDVRVIQRIANSSNYDYRGE